MSDKIWNQKGLLKEVITFMDEEGIISHRQAVILKNKVRTWWFTKTNQIDGVRKRRKELTE